MGGKRAGVLDIDRISAEAIGEIAGDMPDYTHVREFEEELYEILLAKESHVDSWWYWFGPQEGLVLMCYLSVRLADRTRESLHLERFEDQEVAVAVELMLTECDGAISLSPLANRVRHLQLSSLAGTGWDTMRLTPALQVRQKSPDLIHARGVGDDAEVGGAAEAKRVK